MIFGLKLFPFCYTANIQQIIQNLESIIFVDPQTLIRRF